MKQPCCSIEPPDVPYGLASFVPRKEGTGVGKSLTVYTNNEYNSASWNGCHNFENILETGYVDHAYVNHYI